MIYQLAKVDSRVIFIGSDLSPGLLKEMRNEFPDRFFMDGISEANIIGMAAGLAMDGYIPYVVTIGTFFYRRAYDQIAIDLCLHNLPVRLVAIGGGLNYAPLGPTHQAIEDITVMRALPNMNVVAVCDADEMKRFMSKTLDIKSPIYIRLAKGFEPIISKDENGFEFGKAIVLHKASKKAKKHVLINSTSIMTNQALLSAEKLKKYEITCTIIHHHTIKPLDSKIILKYAPECDLILTLEENVLAGGFGSACLETIIDSLNPSQVPPILRLGLPDMFVSNYGTQESLMEYFGLLSENITAKILEKFN